MNLLNIDEYNEIHYKDTSLSMILLNIRSFNKNINKLLIFIDNLTHKPDIIILTETWLTDKDYPDIYFPNYNIFIKNRILSNKKRGGGVLILVSKLIECCIIEDLYCSIMDYIDIISIKIIINSNDFKIISSVYRSPDYNGNDFINLLFNLFHKYISREMYICGDYNINLLNNTVLSNSFKNILIQLGISNIIDMPTRITQNSISSLDNIFTNCSDVIQGVIHTDISDHSLIFCIFNYNLFIKRKDQYTNSRNINEFNLHNLKLELGTIHWNTILNKQNGCELYNTFIDILTNSINKHCPFIKKRIKLNHNFNPWLNNKLKNAIKKKNKLYTKYKINNCPCIFGKYKKLKNKINKNIKI